MGKRRALISAVKKAIICEAKEKREKKTRKPRRWFRKRTSKDLNAPSMENAMTNTSSHSPMDEVKLIEAENEQNRHAYSVALVTAMAAEAAVAAAQAAAEVVRLRAAATTNSGKTKEEVAVVKIQTAFRGYLARRTLKALRGLVRLKSLIGGQSIKRQASATLKCMQTMARLQSEIRARRVKSSDVSSAIQRKIQQKRDKEIEKSRVSNGENWDDSMQSKEQIEANLHNRQEAAMRRERALAYAYSHQQTWRNSSNSANQTFMDPNNPHWGWSWLERWMSTRPWENDNNTLDKQSQTNVNSPKTPKIQSPKPHKPSSVQLSPSTPKSRVSTKKIRPYTDVDDSKSINSTQSERCRRLSGAGSSMRDDESLASSPAVPSYMGSTESARAKSRAPSPLGTPEKASSVCGGSAKKRLSFSGSPAGGQRHRRSVGSTKSGVSPIRG